MASEKKQYEFTEEGFFLGKFYKVGARASFHPEQVRFDLHRMKEFVQEPVKKAPAAKADK